MDCIRVEIPTHPFVYLQPLALGYIAGQSPDHLRISFYAIHKVPSPPRICSP